MHGYTEDDFVVDKSEEIVESSSDEDLNHLDLRNCLPTNSKRKRKEPERLDPYSNRRSNRLEFSDELKYSVLEKTGFHMC